MITTQTTAHKLAAWQCTTGHHLVKGGKYSERKKN